MRYVMYKLKRVVTPTGEEFHQPVCETGATFLGGQYSNGIWYLGYIDGSDVQVQDFVASCAADFSMYEASINEAKNFILQCAPSSITDGFGNTLYPLEPEELLNGVLVMRWTNTPPNIPSIQDRVNALEDAMLDLLLMQ